MAIKTRFCPSPTGLIHMGNARTALFSYLLAHHHHGKFLLRIEDTDKERSKEEYTAAMMADLRWLGLQWDEGPEHEGENGPYWQSQRQDIYDQFYHHLLDAQLAYPCFCSEEKLALTRKVQRASGQPPRYPGTCRHLSAQEVDKKISEGMTPTLRFKIPDDEAIEFTDIVKGPQRIQSNDIGDFIVRRTDGTAPFMYCNAIDDALMGVTHVIRGEDHLTNTPRQILILQALKLPVPQYGHITLIVGSDNSPLSKRHGSRSIQQLAEMGYLPIAVNNYMGRLGHYYVSNDLMNLAELSANFSIENLSKSPAHFDISQLQYWQKQAVEHLTEQQMSQWLMPYLKDKVPEFSLSLFIETIKNNMVFPQDAQAWADIFFNETIEFSEDELILLRQAGKSFFEQARDGVKNFGADYQALCDHLKAKLGVKGKELFQPLRVALSKQVKGPELVNIFTLLGDELLARRFQDVIDQI